MDNYTLETTCELKPVVEQFSQICRCCLTTKRPMKVSTKYSPYFVDLAGIDVSESDGFPQWICVDCCSLLQKAVKFKQKMLKAHNLLYEYLTRCAPFPVDGQDPELVKYASPHLQETDTLTFDNGKGKSGFHKVLQHIKQVSKSELQFEAPVAQSQDEQVKEETLGFSDYEDNITLEEFRSNVSKLTEEDVKITEDDLANLLENLQEEDKPKTILEITQEETKKKKKAKKKDKKDLEDKGKRKKISIERNSTDDLLPKATLRKPIELDPTKIRVITLNPEEQIKMREEESKLNHKFPFQCHLCFKGFNFESKLQNHMSKHDPSRGQFECKLCSMFLPTSYSFSVHSLIHTRRYECLKCSRTMIDRASILEHYKTQHEGLLTNYTCHLCGKISNNGKTHRGHMRNHHSGERPSCDQCGKSFINKDSLAEHIQIHLGIKNYSCGTCGKRFRTRTQIKHHQLKHTDAREFYCVECDTRFKSAHSLRQHLLKSLRHKDVQSLKFPCTRCDKRFDSASRLATHVSIQHEGARPHSCGSCGAALATRASLHKHVAAVHRGQRPPPRHVCHTCGKAFRGKSVLVNHVRTHTGEKPFECTECGRKFTQRAALKTHVKLVHLKIRRNAKIKPEIPEGPKLDMFPKQESATVVFEENWDRVPIAANCNVYYISPP